MSSKHRMSNFTFTSTTNAPRAIGPYSQAVSVGSMIYTSGQIGFDPITMELKQGLENQANQVMENLKAVLEGSDSNLNNVIKTTVFLKDMNDFAAFNEIYMNHFQSHRPARSCVQVARLPKDALVEVECIAARIN